MAAVAKVMDTEGITRAAVAVAAVDADATRAAITVLVAVATGITVVTVAAAVAAKAMLRGSDGASILDRSAPATSKRI